MFRGQSIQAALGCYIWGLARDGIFLLSTPRKLPLNFSMACKELTSATIQVGAKRNPLRNFVLDAIALSCDSLTCCL
jgi:hypothetical protein